MKNYLAYAAAIIIILSVIPYSIDILKGRTKPNVVSWLTWTILLSIATAAAFAAHEPHAALLTLGDTIATGAVLLLGIRHGIAKFSWFDGMCQLGAVVGLILWFVLNSPSVAIMSSLLIDLIASVPTFRHAWKRPKEETSITFIAGCLASSLTLLSLSSFGIASLAFPIYLLVNNFIIASIVISRGRRFA